MLALYVYEHGGITMSCEPFASPWDSGQVGVIVCTPDKIDHEWGECADKREKAESYLKGEVLVYDQFIRGDVWGFVITEDIDACDSCGHAATPTHVDDCWGFYDLEDMKEHVQPSLHDQLVEAWENRGG